MGTAANPWPDELRRVCNLAGHTFWDEAKITSRITAFNRPFHFRDEQVKRSFKYIIHDHYFEIKERVVIIKDFHLHRL